MKFEFVEFYPFIQTKDRKPRNIVGTLHIYAIDCKLDIRGISVTMRGKSLFFNLPHYRTIDAETGEPVTYPHLRWQDQSVHREMMNFLHKEVKPLIRERLNAKSK